MRACCSWAVRPRCAVPPAAPPVPAGVNNYNRRTIATLQRIAIARRAAEIQPFEVMDVLTRTQALERAGRRVVHMEIGEPDFTAPAPVVEAGVQALRDGRTAYTPALGLESLRSAIAGHYRRRFGCEIPAARIAITSGASGGLLCVSALYVDAG